MSLAYAAAPAPLYPWEPESAIRANLAIGELRQLLVKRMSHGNAVPTLLSAAGSLVGFAAQNAALEQGELLAQRRDLVAPKSLILYKNPHDERYLLGSWINGPLLTGYGHAFPMLGFLAKAAAGAGLKAADFPDINAIERRLASAIKEPGCGRVLPPEGHRLAAPPQDLLKALWPRARKALVAPMPVSMADEPPLDEAHWPILLSIVAGMLISVTKDAMAPGPALALVVESALVASRLDPDLIDPGRWKLAPGRAGLQIAKAERFRRVG
jgi:hypothetical protein